MFVAHHWGQRRRTHGAEAKLKKGSDRAADLDDFPMVLFVGGKLRDCIDQEQPADADWKDHRTQQVANDF